MESRRPKRNKGIQSDASRRYAYWCSDPNHGGPSKTVTCSGSLGVSLSGGTAHHLLGCDWRCFPRSRSSRLVGRASEAWVAGTLSYVCSFIPNS